MKTKILESILQTAINAWYSSFTPFYDLAISLDEPRGARESLIEKLNIQEGDKIIELGAGTGRNIQYYPSTAKVYCLDINKRMLKKAEEKAEKQKKYNITFEIGDAKNLKFEDNYFDVCVLTYALSGIPSNKKVMSELKRVIKPEGRIGILDFNSEAGIIIGGIAGIDLEGLIRDSKLKVLHEEILTQKYGSEQRIYVLKK